jgi:Rab GDP dissociation inhibitor
MNEAYDVIVCNIGLKECVFSGLLATKGKKVLHIDRNEYYGGETASLNLTNMWKKFKGGEAPPK